MEKRKSRARKICWKYAGWVGKQISGLSEVEERQEFWDQPWCVPSGEGANMKLLTREHGDVPDIARRPVSQNRVGGRESSNVSSRGNNVISSVQVHKKSYLVFFLSLWFILSLSSAIKIHTRTISKLYLHHCISFRVLL